MSSMSAYFATVFRLTWSTRAISDLERPAASIDRISFTVSRGTVISPVLPGRARQSNRPGKPYGGDRAPGPRGTTLLFKLLGYSCSRCSAPGDHSDHFLVNINRRARQRVGDKHCSRQEDRHGVPAHPLPQAHKLPADHTHSVQDPRPVLRPVIDARRSTSAGRGQALLLRQPPGRPEGRPRTQPF